MSYSSLTNNEQSKKDIQKASPLTTASKKMKMLGINLMIASTDLYIKNL